MGKTVLAELVTKMTVESSQFKKELEKTTAQTYKHGQASKKAANDNQFFSDSFKDMMSKAGALKTALFGSTAAIVAVGAAAYANARHTASNAAEITKLSDLAGESVQNFQSLAFAFGLLGVEQDKFADISKDTNEKLGEFLQTGGGGFKDFFDNVAPKVGLTADALKNLSSTDVLIAVKRAMDDANLSMKEQSFYLESIASDATLLIPALADGGAQIKKYAGEYDNLNSSLTETDIAKLKEFDVNTKLLEATMQSLGDTLAVITLPALTGFTNWLKDQSSLFASFSKGEDSVASLNAELKVLYGVRERALANGSPIGAYNKQITALLSKIQAFSDQAQFEKESEVSLEEILQGVFSNRSGSVGDVGKPQAVEFANNIWSEFQSQLEFNAQSSSFTENLFNLDENGYDFTTLTDQQNQEIKLKQEHNQALLELERMRIEQEKQMHTSNFLSDLQTIGAQSKKLYGIAKAAAIAKAVINTYDAANQALAAPYPWPVPQVFAGVAIAAGMANVAAIKSQSVPSFEGGGYIPDGPRIGGVDNRGGQYAIVHPNESIVDHNLQGKSQGSQVNQVINISPQLNDVSGFDRWYKQNRNRITRDIRDAGRV